MTLKDDLCLLVIMLGAIVSQVLIFIDLPLAIFFLGVAVGALLVGGPGLITALRRERAETNG